MPLSERVASSHERMDVSTLELTLINGFGNTIDPHGLPVSLPQFSPRCELLNELRIDVLNTFRKANLTTFVMEEEVLHEGPALLRMLSPRLNWRIMTRHHPRNPKLH